MKKIQEKYQLKNSVTIIYTHGCRKKKGIFTRASIVIEEQKIAYNISIADQCTTFTVKAFVIKAALEIMYNDENNKRRDIVILSDVKSVLQVLTNNQLNVYTTTDI